MKKLTIIVCVVVTSLLFISVSVAQAVDAPSTKGKWGLGMRGGMSVYTQDPTSDTSGDVGIMLSGIITYGATDWLTLGFSTEWETHSIDVIGTASDLGDMQTVSLLPFLEFRKTFGALAPYGLLGVGININWFEEEDDITVSGDPVDIKIDLDESLALRVGGGVDYFITENAAFNTELGWKWNEADVDSEVRATGLRVSGKDVNLSVFSALIGFRYYF